MPDQDKNKHPIDVYVGKKIREARKERNYSQEKVGEAVGVSFQQIQRYEAGSNKINVFNLWKISQFLNKPLLFFVGPEFELKAVMPKMLKEDGTLNLNELNDPDLIEKIKNLVRLSEKEA